MKVAGGGMSDPAELGERLFNLEEENASLRRAAELELPRQIDSLKHQVRVKVGVIMAIYLCLPLSLFSLSVSFSVCFSLFLCRLFISNLYFYQFVCLAYLVLCVVVPSLSS